MFTIFYHPKRIRKWAVLLNGVLLRTFKNKWEAQRHKVLWERAATDFILD